MEEVIKEYEILKITNVENAPYDLLLLADPSEQAVEDYLGRGICYILKSEEVLGVYVIINTRPHTMELVNVAVKENMHGKGLGKKLIQHAIASAKASGANTLEVGTGNSSIGQLALYQRCGFRMIAIDRDFFLKNYDEEIIENGIQCRDMVRLSMDL